MTTQTIPLENENAVEAAQELVQQIPNYGLTWLAYIGLTLLMVGIIWYAIRKWHFVIKWLVASLIFAGALTPTHPAQDIDTYSPLILSAIVNLFDGYMNEFFSGVKTLGIVWAVIFVLGIGTWLLLKKLKAKSSEEDKASPEMATPIEPKVED